MRGRPRKARPDPSAPNLFTTEAPTTNGVVIPGGSDQKSLVEAEHTLLDLADYVYGHTSLKPISKTLFFISRCLCVAKLGGGAANVSELTDKYQALRASLNGSAPDDDFDFSAVVTECHQHIPRVLDAVNKVCRLTTRTDSLGLVFNTLLRGKFEGGEGMGTYLTPEEVVLPMVDILFSVVGEQAIGQLRGKTPLLYGDICGGTGRFVYSIARRLEKAEVPRNVVEKTARLFDQSLMAVDLGKLNFLFEGMEPTFERVGDSLIASQVSALQSRFLLLATNPPFGAGKYRWNAEIAQTIPFAVLSAIGLTRPGDTADPSELFFFRNLDLLALGGALAIVLPDGVVQSEDFKRALFAYENVRSAALHVAAIVSLPSVTFALGGTVAKTSFVIVQKLEKPVARPLYVAVAHHVGFVKRAKKRGDDPKGNDLVPIADEFTSGHITRGCFTEDWRTHESLVPARLLHASGRDPEGGGTPLSELVSLPRDYGASHTDSSNPAFHVSILDVDATGLIDILMASKNKPVSKGLACRPGDILVSCLNPKIWRVGVIPKLTGTWTCSPEFAVLRPKKIEEAWKIAFALHHPNVTTAVEAMGKGTSSSRQRVPKDRLLTITIPSVDVAGQFAQYVAWREDYYEKRLREAREYETLHAGGRLFSW